MGGPRPGPTEPRPKNGTATICSLKVELRSQVMNNGNSYKF